MRVFYEQDYSYDQSRKGKRMTNDERQEVQTICTKKNNDW